MSIYREHHCDDMNCDGVIDDECTEKLLVESDTCLQCEKLSTSRRINESKTLIWTDEIKNSVNLEDLNANPMISSVMFPQERISLSSADNFEIPTQDQYVNIAVQNGHVIYPQDHCHTQVLYLKRNVRPWRQLIAAVIMCSVFMLAEVIGGYLAGSTAVMTDAAHLLSDIVGFLVSIFAIWIGQRPPTKRLSFGYYRAEILSALLSIMMIWMLTGIFVYLAVLRLLHRDFKIEADTMMFISGISVIINIIMGLTLHGVCTKVLHGHNHSEVHSVHSHHTYTSCKSKLRDDTRNVNVRAAAIHVIGDLIQSIGVFVAAIIIKCYPKAKLLDPICTFVFSLMVPFTTISMLRDTVNVLMEGFPKHFEYMNILKVLKSIEGVQSVHSLHVWSLTLDKCALAVHLAINNSVDFDIVLKKALKLIKNKLNVDFATVQVEKYSASAMEDCAQCRSPID